ncbi:MAG: nucleotidyltransferase domain-containing protein [Armatimonadota bacterium]
MQPSSKVLSELVDRIVAVTQPIRILLFGSGARGEMKPDSDLDVLIVVPEGQNTNSIARLIYRNLIGFDLPVDLVVTTESDLNRYGQNVSLVYRSALRDGRQIYAA